MNLTDRSKPSLLAPLVNRIGVQKSEYFTISSFSCCQVTATGGIKVHDPPI